MRNNVIEMYPKKNTSPKSAVPKRLQQMIAVTELLCTAAIGVCSLFCMALVITML